MARRDRRATSAEYEPDAIQKALAGFFKALTASGERVIYLIVVAAVALVVAAWFLMSYRQEKGRDALNAIEAAIEKGDTEELDRLLEQHSNMPETAVWVLDRANVSSYKAANTEDAAEKTSNLQQAEKFYRLFIDRFPRHELAALAYHGRGCVLEQQGEDEGALSEFRKALETAPANMRERFSYDVGRVLTAQGRGDEAMPYLEEAALGEKVITQNPQNGQVVSLRAGSPGARMMIIEGDYQWRLNAKQLLAELKDEAGAEKVKALVEKIPEEKAEEEVEKEKAGEEGGVEEKAEAEGEETAPDKKEGAEKAQPVEEAEQKPEDAGAAPDEGAAEPAAEEAAEEGG